MRIYVATVSHKHGTFTLASRTEKGARAMLAGYCREYWKEADTGAVEEPPTDDGNCIDLYFGGHDYEFYSINSCELADDPEVSRA